MSKSREPSIQSQLKKTNSEFADLSKHYALLVLNKDEAEKRVAKFHGVLAGADRDIRNNSRALRLATGADEIATLKTKHAELVGGKEKVVAAMQAAQATVDTMKEKVKAAKAAKKELQAKLERELLLKDLEKTQQVFEGLSKMLDKPADEKAVAPLSPVKTPVSLLFTPAPMVVAPVQQAVVLETKLSAKP